MTKTAPEKGAAERFDFLAGGADTCERLIYSKDAGSPLGPPARWSPTLKTLMAAVLPAHAQINLFWGPQYIALYNEAYAHTIGDKHPRALGRPAVESWTEFRDDLEPLLRRVRETGETFSARDRPFYIERHGRGETAYFDVSYSAVRETDGSVGGVLCVVSETTQRVQFERRQTFLLELGQALPSVSDPDQVQALVLHRLADELGAARAFFAQHNADRTAFTVQQSYPPRPCAATSTLRYDASEADLLRSGRPLLRHGAGGLPEALHVPIVLHHALEAILVIEHRYAQVFCDHEAHLAEETAKLGWAWITRARAEAALRTSSAQLSAIFDQASVGIALCDDAWLLTRVNDRYCEIVGRSREELLAHHEIGQSSEAWQVAPACERSLQRGQQFETSRSYSHPDGSTVWTQNHVTALLDRQGSITGTLCVCVDISERVRAEAQLRALNEGLEDHVASMIAQREAAMAQLHEAHKLDLVGQLTGGFAHDFNNLLTPIMASLELIRRRVADERSGKLVDGALQAADRARILVERLLSFAQRQTLKPHSVSLSTVIGEMRDLIQRSLGPMTELLIDIPTDMPTVFIDPHQLELAILNLTVNARDAMLDGGRLKILAELDELEDGAVNSLGSGRYVQLMVVDSGSGMDEETLRRCTEPFYSTKDVGKGTGLGLPMVQGLLGQSGGGFDIASQTGQGTRVSLWLPTTDAPACHENSQTEENLPRAQLAQ